MKAYKGFDKNMQSNGYQFAEGESYERKSAVKLDKRGFHVCEDPLDCMAYYDPCNSVYHAVDVDGVSAERGNDTTLVCKKIKIGAQIGIKEMVKSSVDYAFAACKNGKNIDSASGYGSSQAAGGNGSSQAASGGSSSQAASGYGSRQAASGDRSGQAASGDYSIQAASEYGSRQAASGFCSRQAAGGYGSIQAACGNRSSQAASGDDSSQAACGNLSRQAASGFCSRQAACGNGSIQAACGNRSNQAASGDDSSQAACGNLSRQAACGDWSRQETTGKNCVMMSAGDSGMARGKIGSWIVLTEWVDGVPNVVAKRIDGEEIKEDTWYMAKDGKLVEAK